MKTENKHTDKRVEEIKKEAIRGLLQKMIDDDDEIMVELNNSWARWSKNYDLIYKHLDADNLAEDFDEKSLAELLMKGNFNNEAKYYRVDDNGDIHTDWGEVIEVEEIVEDILTYGVSGGVECCDFSDETVANALRPHLVEYMNNELKLGITLEESEYVLGDQDVLFGDWSDDDFILCLKDDLEDYRSELEN